MKPFFNFNDCYPFTLGVADDYFTLSTRLKRLNRARHQPRRATTWLVCGVLTLSFAAVLPFELRARAQSQAAAPTQTLSGTVRDYAGKPVAGATVYAMAPLRNGDAPLQSATTDANGQFRLSGLKGRPEFTVDAGARGMVHLDHYRDLNSPLEVRVAPAARTRLRFVDDNGKPIGGLKVSLRRAGPSPNLWANVPKSILEAMRGTTDARGEVDFRALPANFVAQFQLDAAQLQARQLSQIGIDELVNLGAPQTDQTIVIHKTTVLVGRVIAPDGAAAIGTTVTTRRISDAEAQGVKDALGSAWESYGKPVAVDAKGNYKIENLRPGNYQIWFAPGPKNSNGIEFYKKQTLKAPLERVDAVMSRGGLIQGVIVSQLTGKPIKGQTMGLRNSQGSYDYAISDARGYFRFRALAGAQHLWVHANGTNSPPPGYALPTKSEFDFALKVGEKREFKIALPTKPQIAPVRGTVVGPDGRAVAGASVFYRSVAGWGADLKKSAPTDASGRFVLPAESVGQIVQLFADKGDLTTPYSMIVAPGKSARLPLAQGAWASIEGRITDENQRPLAGIAVNLTHFYGRSGISGDRTSTDKNGEFRYARVRPNTSALLDATKSGYTTAQTVDFAPLATGQTRRLKLTMQRASQTLSGIVYGTDGQPARGYSVLASGQSQNVRTDGNGRFQIPQVLEGAISIWVSRQETRGASERKTVEWQPVKATGGDRNVVIRLAQVPRDTREQDARRDEERALKNVVKPETLTGKMAPPIRATRWANDRALSLEKLRGKPVFLFLKQLYGNDGEIRDLARSVGERVQFVGVQLELEGLNPQFQVSAEEAARRMGFPIAVDAALPDKNAAGWQTAQSYGYAQYVVIGRDGRVVYAGDEIERAIELVLAQ